MYQDIKNTKRPRPDLDRRLGAGPGGAAPPPLGISYILLYLWRALIYLDMFWYLIGIFLCACLYQFATCLVNICFINIRSHAIDIN